jgi:hypothetical protein
MRLIEPQHRFRELLSRGLIERQARERGERTGLESNFIGAPIRVPIPADTETACFRIVHEV